MNLIHFEGCMRYLNIMFLSCTLVTRLGHILRVELIKLNINSILQILFILVAGTMWPTSFNLQGPVLDSQLLGVTS
jgi:hypothetical protein